MSKNYDLLILNNCPAFYKINLYNEIAKSKKIFVVFVGFYDQVVISKDFEDNIHFDYIILYKGEINKRNVVSSFSKLLNCLKGKSFQKIIYGGYIEPEFLLLSFLNPSSKNILQTESAAETKLTGIKYYLKKFLLKRYHKVLASGKIHQEMIHKMGFEKEVIITEGVGIITKNKIQAISQSENISPKKLKFIFVGRLIEIKNVEMLVRVFNKNGLSLTILGKGVLEEKLREMALPNIQFTGFVNNDEIGGYYDSHDVFILPSLSEPWGLVVEEALYYKLPLVLSNRVGSLHELLEEPSTGVSFDPENEDDLQRAILSISENFQYFQYRVQCFDLRAKDDRQIQLYLSL